MSWHPIRIEQAPPRPGWQRRVEESGLTFHSPDGQPYWDEGRHVVLGMESAEVLEAAANELHELCLEACDVIVRNGWWEKLAIPVQAVPLVEASWQARDPHLYGRFDFAWTGKGQPKLLEYNADTPTSLLEASIIQWDWLQDVHPKGDQLNSLHEALVARWKEFPESSAHFACSWDHLEDRQTAAYLAETAEQAGKAVELLDMEEIGVGPDGRFTDPGEQVIERLFKLYPWEWMTDELFFERVREQRSIFLEPPWKMLLSNKSLLPVLWELFPNHRLLLPAYFEEGRLPSWPGYVAKPRFGREGANVKIVQSGRVVEETGGDWTDAGFVYQEQTELFQQDGRHCVWGLWMIGDECRGLSVRADASRITGNNSRFLAHRIEG